MNYIKFNKIMCQNKFYSTSPTIVSIIFICILYAKSDTGVFHNSFDLRIKYLSTFYAEHNKILGIISILVKLM